MDLQPLGDRLIVEALEEEETTSSGIVLPDTAKGIALHTGGSQFEVEDLWDPEINVRYGAFYLRRLLNKYWDVRLALAAYNAGQTNVDEWRANGEGIVFPETRQMEVRNALSNNIGLGGHNAAVIFKRWYGR